jgi:hypothetical protein
MPGIFRLTPQLVEKRFALEISLIR